MSSDVPAGDGLPGAEARLPSRIAFLGFGLIGGSIAAALRQRAGRGFRLVAWTPAGAGPREGLRRGLLDDAAATIDDAIRDAELIILAGPPRAIVATLGGEADVLRAAAERGATITDVGSSKGRILDAAAAGGLPFVGGHPMAGREKAGAAAATADLFIDRPWVVIPGEHARAGDVARVEAVARATGARPMRLDADRHDAAVARISHLPLVVAAALVEAVVRDDADWTVARGLAASGWADTTRLAKGDPEMGAGIVATNSSAILATLRSLRAAVDRWIEQLERDPGDAAVRARLEAARAALLDDAPTPVRPGEGPE